MSETINKVKGLHFNYIPPCFNNYAFVFPYKLNFKLDENSYTILKVIDFINDDNKDEWLIHSDKNVDLKGRIITKLIVSDLKTMENESAIITLSCWSQKYLSLRSPLGRQAMITSLLFF